MMLGIDPGVHGAVAWLSDEGHLIEVQDIPVVEVKVGKTVRRRIQPALLAELLCRKMVTMAFLEEVGPMPRDGAVQGFNLGKSAGLIEGVLAGCGIAYTTVRPQVWKKALGLSSDKEKSRERAIQLWPGAAANFSRKKDADRAESALIGAWGAKSGRGAS